MNKKNLVATVIIAQLVVIVGLFININKGQSLGISVSPVKKQAIFKPLESKYKYFYELLPDSKETFKQELVNSDKQLTYLTNYDSLNERFDYTIKKDPGTFRIITLGDSFTFGYNVSTSDNWSEVLEKFLIGKKCGSYDKFEVINLGVYGYDVQYGVERYRMRGQKYDPDLVIWLVKDDDLNDIEEMKKKILFDEGEDTTEPDVQAYLDAWQKLVTTYGEDNVIAYQAKALDSIRNYFKKELLVLNLGEETKVANAIDKFSKKTTNTHMLKLKLDREMTFSDGHPDEKGHIYIADKIYDYMIKNGTILCRE